MGQGQPPFPCVDSVKLNSSRICIFFRPFGACPCFAVTLGCNLSPLRGWLIVVIEPYALAPAIHSACLAPP